MENIQYREAIGADIPQIVELWKEFIDFHKAGNDFFTRSKEGPDNFGNYISENMHKDDAVVYVAEADGNVVAYILAMVRNYPPAFEMKRYGFVSDLAVGSRYRRSGIGAGLFSIAREWFVDKGMKRIELDVAVTNEVSTSFWHKMNFKPYKEVCYLELE